MGSIEKSLRVLGLLPIANAALPEIKPGQKLTRGADGVRRLEPDGERFSKAATAPGGSDLVKSILSGRRTFTARGRAELTKGLRKRAEAVAVTEAQRQGLTPSVGALPGDHTTPGLSDDPDAARFLVGLTPEQADALLALIATIRENASRRASITDDAYGVTPDRRTDNFGNSAKLRGLIKAAVDSSVARMNATFATTTLARIAPDDPNAAHKMLVKTLQTGRRSIFDPEFRGAMGA